MLREVFRTVPIPYQRFPFRGTNEMEKLLWVSGIHAGIRPATVTTGDTGFGPSSIYLWAMFDKGFVGGHDAYFRFDGVTGKVIRRIGSGDIGGLASMMTLGGIITARSGTPYAVHSYGNILYKMTLGATASALIGDEPETMEFWDIVAEGESVEGILGPDEGYSITRFEPYTDPDGRTGKLFGYGIGGAFALDDINDAYLDVSTNVLRVFSWKTGTFRYGIILPHQTVAIALEDDSRCYILLNDRSVILLDYERAEILGAGEIPPPVIHRDYKSGTRKIQMAWDSLFRRLLISEQVPDNPDGSCATRIRGYRMVEYASRVTTPIPLKVPRRGRTIPVLIQVVNERNDGLGSYAIDCTVTGEGSLVGQPITDHHGSAFAQVKCHESLDYYGGYDEMASIGGNITVTASVKIPIPIAPIRGVPGPAPGGGAAPGPPVAGTPPPPSGGTTPPPSSGGLPAAQAPNMTGTLIQVYDAGAPNGKPWDLSDGNKYNANGNGVFVESAVRAMHDINSGFGHLRKNPGSTQYNGHAIDATVYKRTDGILESIDFISGNSDPSLHGGHIIWLYNWHYTDTSLWYYPA